MKISFFIFLSLVFGSAPLLAQDSLVHPFIGITFNTAGYGCEFSTREYAPVPGIGFEVGGTFRIFYAGFEYGVYGDIKSDTLFTASLSKNYRPPPTIDEAITRETYIGLHVGVKILDWLSVGVVIIRSSQAFDHSILVPIDSVYYTYNLQSVYTISWLNFGPDIRFYPWRHFVANLAYTKRRGGKFGIDYLF